MSTIQEGATGSPVNCEQNACCTLFRNGLIASLLQPGTKTSLKQSCGDVQDCSASSDATWKTEDAEEREVKGSGLLNGISEKSLGVAKQIQAP
jgi:hypothetical protein